MIRILTLLFFVPLFCSAQDVLPKNVEGKYEFTEVVNVDSANADKLYSRAKIFIVDAFKSGKDVTQLNDDASKTVIGKGIIQISFKSLIGSADKKLVNFKLTIQCKDGRYKYTLTNFVLEMIGPNYNDSAPLEDEERIKKHMLGKKQTAELFDQLNEKIKALITNLKNTMAGKTSSTKDW
jgi:hypothetical protein